MMQDIEDISDKNYPRNIKSLRIILTLILQ